MKDNFSALAGGYSKYRPYYPPEMIEYIVSFVKEKHEALDVATGNGQVAIELSKHFKKVYATDISQKQLDNATQADNIVYKVESAEHTAFADGQFDLITVAQAIHWFDFEAFYKEVYRILKPDGVFAVLGYGLFSTNPETDKLLRYFYYETIGPFWDPERKYIDNNYTTIPFPFDEIEVKQFMNEFIWTFDQLIGYLETWSAVQHYTNKVGKNPVNDIKDALKISWEKSDKKVTFPLLLRIGKIV
ncbi:class I SAM-dependent methyltransferase [Flavobacterium cerinum]|uniref:Class I SAM-dependent methyltransferase n=1 Tax=Flavobacterium cerinum TaxID=2502784 RepID=A0A3S3TSW6_9FLAO|nr:class I SAM-dependent methyltransferase [Flavobacterium cerinum]RWW92051.1 class I SAM-dependent methyltransferase [Flavobacterium cerinum]